MGIKGYGNFDLNENRDVKIWRYLSIDKLEDILKSKTLYMPSVRRFSSNDKFEGSATKSELSKLVPGVSELSPDKLKEFKQVYRSSLISGAFEALLDMTYASCWHRADHESFLMWMVYGASKSISLQTTIGKLSDSIGDYYVDEKFKDYKPETIWASNVKYINYNEISDSIGTLGRFFSKRLEYSDEKEFRLLLSLEYAVSFAAARPGIELSIPIDVSSLIEKIYLSPFEDRGHEDKLMLLLKKYSIDREVLIHSELSDYPIY